jgi:hypothetical protein
MENQKQDKPSINVIENFISACFSVFKNKVLPDPGNKVVLESALY